MTPCKNWPGPAQNGHGVLDKNLSREAASRFVWRAAHGAIPPGHYVAQTCRNGRCIELTHLVLMTVREFTAELSNSPAGLNARKTKCLNGHQFTVSNTYITPGSGQRQCRACKAAADLRRRARSKVNA